MVTAAHPVCVLRGLTHTDTESRAPGWDQSLVTTYRSPWLWRSHKHFPANKRKYFRLWLHVMSRVQCHVQMLRMFRLRLSLWTRWRWIMSEQAKYSMNLYRGILSEESSFLHASDLLRCPRHLIMAEYLRCLAPCPHQPCRHRPDHLWQIRRVSRGPRLRLVCPG